MTIRERIYQKTSWRRIGFFFLTSVLTGTAVITQLFGLLQVDSLYALDPLAYYSSDIFYRFLELQGDGGRSSYLWLHLLDYLFIGQFYIFFVYLIQMLLPDKILEDRASLISLLPLFSASMDLLENLSIDISLLLYPGKWELLGHLSGYFTAAKFYSLYLVFLLTAVLGILALIRWIIKRTQGKV